MCPYLGINGAFMEHDNMFYNGKSQTSASESFGAGFVDNIKPFKDVGEIFIGDAHSRVPDINYHEAVIVCD